jgi:molybdopterin synthase catalytic subunit
MSVSVTITDGPLGPFLPPGAPAGAGALVLFEGIVREREADGPIDALDYEAYQPMAQRMLARIGDDLTTRLGLLGLWVEHSRGRVGVGRCSFRLVIAAPHRKEALAAMDEFIDRLKQDVPIWKVPVWRRATVAPARPSDRPDAG